MNINVSIIDQQVRGLATRLHAELEAALNETLNETKARSVAFVVLCQKVMLDLTEDEALEGLTEGSNDFGVDAIDVSDPVDGEFTVTMFQGKYNHANLEGVKGFPEDGVVKAVEAVRALFNPSAPLQINKRLQARVEEIRSFLLDGHIPVVRVLLCNNGQTWSHPAAQAIIDRENFPDRVRFEHVNHDVLIRVLASAQPAKDTLQFAGKSIVEDFNYARVFVGKVPVTELSRLMQAHGDRLLERNIRRYLGLQGNRVNESIARTLRSDSDRTNFFFYNNGVTLICDRFDFNALQPENHKVKVEGLQIINGGQTSKTIEATLKTFTTPPADLEQTYVMVRLYQVPRDSTPWVQTITYFTNSQNPVDLRDLHANDERQKALELSIRELGYHYRRQRTEGVLKPDEIGTATAAEALISVWRRKPHQARFHAIEHFGKLYDFIFPPDLSAAQLVTAVLLYRLAENKRKRPPPGSPDFIAYASHFAAMLMGQYLLDELNVPLQKFDHRSFDAARQLIETKGDEYFHRAVADLAGALGKLYPEGPLVSLRRLSATFRRFDLFQFLPAPAAATGLSPHS